MYVIIKHSDEARTGPDMYVRAGVPTLEAMYEAIGCMYVEAITIGQNPDTAHRKITVFIDEEGALTEAPRYGAKLFFGTAAQSISGHLVFAASDMLTGDTVPLEAHEVNAIINAFTPSKWYGSSLDNEARVTVHIPVPLPIPSMLPSDDEAAADYIASLNNDEEE